METKIVWLTVALAAAAVGALIPTSYTHRSLFPTEDPKFIRRVYADHTVGQTFHSRYEVNRILLLMRASHPGTQMFTAAVGDQTFDTKVNLNEHDQWVSLVLPTALPAGEYRLNLSAPHIQEQADAILVRFQVDSTNFEPGYMIVDEKKSYGDVAFQLDDRIPAFLQMPRYFTAHPNHTVHVFRVTGLALVLATLAYLLSVSPRGWRYALLALAVFTIVIRIPTLAQIDGVFGGDAFNYLSKAKAWIAGDDPFNADPRKAPLWPFVLIPTYLTKNPLLWSRFAGAVSAGIAASAVAATVKRLGMSVSISLLAGTLVAVNRELWWESLNGLANVPYAALIALSTLGLVSNKPFAASLTSVLATLTRYEGILVAAIYLPAVWLRKGFRLSALRRLLIPLVLLAIPFVFWPISGGLGVRTAGDVFEDAGLYIAWDWGDYLMNMERAKAFFQELWFFRHDPPLSWLNDTINLTAILGGLLLVKRRPIVGISLILVGLVQIAVVTAILPKTRYYVQIIPLLVVGAVTTIHLLPRRAAFALLCFLVASVWVNTRLHLPTLVEDYNHRGRTDSPLIQAAVFFNKTDAKPAFAINFLPVETLLPRSQTIFSAPETADEQLAWLREKQATHVVEMSEYPWFEELVKKYPQHFQHVTSFKASYDPAEATIYEVRGL